MDDEIDYGDQYPNVIEEHLDASAAVVLIMSEHSRGSRWVANELAFAMDQSKTILPLLLSGRKWVSLAAVQHADVTARNLPPDDFYDRLDRVLDGSQFTPRPRPTAGTEDASFEQLVGLIRRELEALLELALPWSVLNVTAESEPDVAIFDSIMEQRLEADAYPRGFRLAVGLRSEFELELEHGQMLAEAGWIRGDELDIERFTWWLPSPGPSDASSIHVTDPVDAETAALKAAEFYCRILDIAPASVRVERG